MVMFLFGVEGAKSKFGIIYTESGNQAVKSTEKHYGDGTLPLFLSCIHQNIGVFRQNRVDKFRLF
jgi:hypothetical protein